MNLNEIYTILDVETMAEKRYKTALKAYEQKQEGWGKRELGKCLAKDYYLAKIYSEIKIALAKNPSTPAEILRELMEEKKPILSETIKSLLAVNPNTPIDILIELNKSGFENQLVQNPNLPSELLQKIFDNNWTETVKNGELEVEEDYEYALFEDIARNANTPKEILRILSESNIPGIEIKLARNPNLPEEIIKKFANLEDVKAGVCAVLENPNIPKELMKQIITHMANVDLNNLGESFETDGEQVRIEDLKLVCESLVRNENISPEIIQEIERLYPKVIDKYVLFVLLENPNTPIDIIERYSRLIDYNYNYKGESPYTLLHRILENPNIPSEILATIKEQLDHHYIPKEDIDYSSDFTIHYYIRTRILRHPNTSKEIIQEYLNKEGTLQDRRAILSAILENPGIFEILKENEMAKIKPLESKEIELNKLSEKLEGLSRDSRNHIQDDEAR